MFNKNKTQAKNKSIWSAFKNAYLRQKNLKSFWNKLDKRNLSKELIETFSLYLNSESLFNNPNDTCISSLCNHLNTLEKGI